MYLSGFAAKRAAHGRPQKWKRRPAQPRSIAALPVVAPAGGTGVAVALSAVLLLEVGAFGGQLVQLDLSGKVLAATGKPGTALGEFGEAHFIAVSPKGELFVADSVNGALVKLVPR